MSDESKNRRLKAPGKPGALEPTAWQLEHPTARRPVIWASWLAHEAALRAFPRTAGQIAEGLLDESVEKTRLATEAENLSTLVMLAEDAETRPPLMTRNGARWPKSRPLPADWTESLYIAADELRAWAAEHFPSLLQSDLIRLGMAEPPDAPATEAAASVVTTKPPQQQPFQEQEILRVIGELGHDPKLLPKRKAGQSGVKAKVRGNLKFSRKVFDKAWERLRASEDIRDA